MSASEGLVLLGLDAASDLGKFGYSVCKINGTAKSRTSQLCDSGVLGNYDHIKKIFNKYVLGARRTVIAIDAPLGWPEPFSNAVSLHAAGRHLSDMNKDELLKRKTDQYVKDRFKVNPLEVSADKIARASVSALNVLSHFRGLCSDKKLELAWSHRDLPCVSAIEVYPAASLKAWGLPHKKYKGFEYLETAKRIAFDLRTRAPWMDELLPKGKRDRGDIFDAGLCVLAAIDFIFGDADGPCAEDMQRATKEGWIWVTRHQIMR